MLDPGDNTGRPMQGRARLNKRAVAKALQTHFRKVEHLKCGECNSDHFDIFADQDPRSGVMMVVCANPNCQKGIPPFEIRAVQANDDILANHGIVLPDPWLSSAPRNSEPSPDEVSRILQEMDDDD